MNDPISHISTLTEMLARREQETPDAVACILDGKAYSYAWIWNRSLAFAMGLQAGHVERTDRVLLLVPNSVEFFIAFYGCLLAGAIAVPIFPGAGTERAEQILRLCGGQHVVLPTGTDSERKKAFSDWAKKKGTNIHWVSQDHKVNHKPHLPAISSGDIAFIQYTSGSTDFPKGVPLTHANLLTNIRQMMEAMKITSEDTFVSWLPVYHDMGLILMTMTPFYTGARLVLLAEGLHRVYSWLKAIEQYGGTFIAAPDVAYRLSVRSVRRAEKYDLSSLRVALNASERVQKETYSQFEGAFGLQQVMVAGYGLAEATVAVTMHPPGESPVQDADGYVASGRPLRGIDIRIDTHTRGSDGKMKGEILVQSAALMKGYFGTKKRQPFDREGYLRTGDIGYIDTNRNLFVLARKKNCIKHAGHTLYPDDVEQAVRQVGQVRHVMAIGMEDKHGNGESLWLFAEAGSHRKASQDDYHALAVDIVQKVQSHFGLRPARVYIVKARTLPRTPNGKPQHAKLKKLAADKTSAIYQEVLYPR